MYRVSLLLLVWSVVFGLHLPATAQSTENTVGWKLVQGKKNEFSVFMPEGYRVVTRSAFFIGQDMTPVSKKTTAFHYINSVVLIFEHYEGSAKTIAEALTKRQIGLSTEIEKSNGAKMTKFSDKQGEFTHLIRLYQTKSRVYLLKSISKSPYETLVEDFFNSVSIKSKDTTKSTFPSRPEAELGRITMNDRQPDSTLVYESDQVDRKAILILGPNTRKYLAPGAITNLSDLNVKMKVLIQPNGVVSIAELSGGSKLTRNAYEKAAKEIIFIPAEKDGVPVASYYVFESAVALKPGVVLN